MANDICGPDATIFCKRIERLYTSWNNENQEDCEEVSFPKMDAIISCHSYKKGDYRMAESKLILRDYWKFCKSSTLQRWILNNVIPNTIVVFTKNSVCFLMPHHYMDLYKGIADNAEDIPPVKLFFWKKNDDVETTFQKLITEIENSGEGKTIGVFPEDKYHGPFMERWKIALQKKNFKMVDFSSAFAYLISLKEDTEICLMEKCSQIIAERLNRNLSCYMVKVAIDSGKKIWLDATLPKSAVKLFKNKYLLGQDYYRYIYTTGQSWFCSSTVNVTRRKSLKSSDVIIISVESRYMSYFGTVTRTLLIDPGDSVRENYEFLLQLEEEIVKNLKADTKICNVYQAGLEFVKIKKPHLIDCLPDNFGFAMGIELEEKSIAIAPTTTIKLKKNMVFNLNVGFGNLSNEQEPDKKNKIYSLFIEDTVLVNENGPATVLTSLASKELRDNTVLLKDEYENIELKNTLILSLSDNNPKLKDLFIRPEIYSESVKGTLEVHINGFKYSTISGDEIDILFNNVKKAFFTQSSDEETSIILYFQLKNAITYGEKNHIDVQLYMKAGEKQDKENLKDSFNTFCKDIQNMRPSFKFNTPFKELSFLWYSA